jgi:hypothetical protein
LLFQVRVGEASGAGVRARKEGIEFISYAFGKLERFRPVLTASAVTSYDAARTENRLHTL